ncbi:hypothetical protein [Haloarcula sediminis]|uniref:hypothetical protein n=1 Tax=Haloarcula sediminis TaxID=3111777 RepID=UPI002D766C14|nr:hypothetical protein [Haloarcula sp. CK38]
MAERDSAQHGERESTDWWETSAVEIAEFGGVTVAYLPEADDAWISGWVDVPR